MGLSLSPKLFWAEDVLNKKYGMLVQSVAVPWLGAEASQFCFSFSFLNGWCLFSFWVTFCSLPCRAMTNLITGGPSGYCSCTEDGRHFAMCSVLPYLPAASSPGRAEASPQRRTRRGRCLWHIQQEAAMPRQDYSSRTGSSGSLLQQDKQPENLHHEFGVAFIELSSRGPLKRLWSRFYTRFPNARGGYGLVNAQKKSQQEFLVK